MATRNKQQQFIPPVLGPDVQRRQLDLQRNAMLAQQLLGQELPQGQMVSGHYVPPSWTQHLAHGLSQFLGHRAMNEMPEQQMQLQQMQQQRMAEMFGLGGAGGSAQQQMAGAQGAQAMPVSAGGEASPQMLGQALSGGMQQQQQPMIPPLPGRSAQDSFMIANNIGLPEYMKLLGKQGAPTNEQRNLAFLPENLRNQMIAAPYMNEAARDGMQMILGADGRMHAVPVAGYAESQAGFTESQARAQSRGQIMGERQGLEATNQARIQDIKELTPILKEANAEISQGNTTVRSVDRNIAYIDRLLANADGLSGVVGQIDSLKPAMLMLDNELEAKADLDSIKSKIVLNTMQEMRAASSAGATGFGNMSNQQLKVIEDSLGSLDRAQTLEQITTNLRVIRDAMANIRNSAVANLDQTAQTYQGLPGFNYQPGSFGEMLPTSTPSDIVGAPQQQPGGIPTISSPEDLRSLPSGSLFIAPDGSTRRKP